MTTPVRTIIGTLAWIAFALAARTPPSGPGWVDVMLAFVALVIMPAAIDLVSEMRDAGRIARIMTWVRQLQLPAAAFLALACGLHSGAAAVLLAFPWAVVTALIAVVGISRILRDGWSRPLDRLSADVGMIFIVIGGLWVLADRAGLRPMRFDPTIVALTAVHFHFAGFLLPICGGLVLRRMRTSRFAARAIVGVALGVPLTAVGIVVTQLGGSPAIEAAAGCGLALSAMGISILHVRRALDAANAPISGRLLVGISGVSLFFAMLLAASYAIRNFVVLLPWLGLPQMRALHGTLDGFGFALCGVFGWWLMRRDSDEHSGNVAP